MTGGLNKSPRHIAVAALFDTFRASSYGDAEIKKHLAAAMPDRRDAAFATAVFYGVIQNRLLINFYISEFSSVKVKKIHPWLYEIISCAIYQMIFMDKVPHSAAVNEAVKLARDTGHARAAGFVNALLRAIGAASDNMPEPPRDDMTEYLSIKYSHPVKLTEFFISLYGRDGAELLMRENNIPSPVTARMNLLHYSKDEIIASLENDGAKTKDHPVLQNCVIISETGDISHLNAYINGMLTVTDAAGCLSVLASKTKNDAKILDMCAAPGAKSLFYAELANNGSVVSCDIYDKKCEIIKKNRDRMGYKNIDVMCRDATEYFADFEKQFDIVVADVPCSGLGIIRKKPDIRFKNLDETEMLPQLQLRILKNAARYVKKGGTLMYSTCTLAPFENESVIEAFLCSTNDFSLTEFEINGIKSKNGMRTLVPHIDGTDGFFIARMTKDG